MEYIDSQGYCGKCKQNVTVRRQLPSINTGYRVMTVLTFGLWPLYLLRIRWHCQACGGRADYEEPHLVARKMGGFTQIVDIHARLFCEGCDETVTVGRKLPPVNSVHQPLSFFTAGSWPMQWIHSAWTCRVCGKPVNEGEIGNRWTLLASMTDCSDCGKETVIQRPRVSGARIHKLLSALTLGGWPYRWLTFGWRCVECGNTAEDRKTLQPKETIDTWAHCKHCDEDVVVHRRLFQSNLFNRLLSLLTFGQWPFTHLCKGWRCSRCGKRVKVKPFDSDLKAIF